MIYRGLIPLIEAPCGFGLLGFLDGPFRARFLWDRFKQARARGLRVQSWDFEPSHWTGLFFRIEGLGLEGFRIWGSAGSDPLVYISLSLNRHPTFGANRRQKGV